MKECPLENGNSAELIVAYGARTLAPEVEAAFERHMSTCANCRELAAAQREVWSAMDAWTPAGISSNFDEKLYRRIATEEQGTWWRRVLRANWSWRPAMPVAAACAVLVAAFLLRSPAPPSGASQSQSQPKLQIEQVQHALDDIEMLKKLGVEVPSDKAGSSEQI
ncbi:MAG TPA: zf-HC2 domain-containing protein [Bryobacteraceae bacterium]|nr:zf-HC2 domain-containing protein [Bryobacteraceae bacterium]